MDIEELTKAQIVLLVLLVSFVTSIATGIVTVALLAKSPPSVPQSVTRIIQRTAETIASTTAIFAPPVVTETTVIVKEDSAVSNAIAKSMAHLGTIYENESASSSVIALAVPLVGNILVTDASVVGGGTHLVTIGTTSAVYKLKNSIPEVNIAVLEPVSPFTPTTFTIADASDTALGQTVFAIPNSTGSRVGIGAVTARYSLARIPDASAEVSTRAIETTITNRLALGSPLLNLKGELIGVATSISTADTGGQGTFVALSDISALLLSVRGVSTSTEPTL